MSVTTRPTSTRITRSSAQRAYSTCVYRPVRVPAEGYSASLAAHGVALSPLSPSRPLTGALRPSSAALRMSNQHSAGSPEAPDPGLKSRSTYRYRLQRLNAQRPPVRTAR